MAHRRTIVLLCFVLLGAAAPDAGAHAALVAATPPPGARVEEAPREVTLRFGEPVDLALTRVRLLDARSGERVAAPARRGKTREEVVLTPSGLGRGAYTIRWHTVSTVDGHTLEGSVGFGVGTAALGGNGGVEDNPLAEGGVARVALRAALYGSLLFFAGGVLCGALLGTARRPAGWLFPSTVHATVTASGRHPDSLADMAWRRTLLAGCLAVLAATAVAIADAADAAGSLRALDDFLFDNDAGLARVGTIFATALAVVSARRSATLAVGWVGVAFLTISLGGHANSADPRGVALFADWAHLVLAGAWIGGIAQIAAAWLGPLGAAAREHRSAMLSAVVDRFRIIALPGFLAVIATGSVRAALELGRFGALVDTTYGRLLTAKIVLVVLIGAAAWWHARRLSPLLLDANPHPPAALERRHRRLLASEPLLALGVVAAAATLVAFPLPPRQRDAASEALAAAPQCSPCPLPLPAADELAVAEQAGSRIAAFWLRRDGPTLTGTVRLLDSNGRPAPASMRLLGGSLTPCGAGCARLRADRAGPTVTLAVVERGREYRATVPARFDATANASARRLLGQAEAAMRRLPSLHKCEALTSGPGTFVRTAWAIKAPDRFRYRTSSGARGVAIGNRRWFRVGGGPWRGERSRAWTARTRALFRWTPYARAVRLVRRHRRKSGTIVELAVMDPGAPVWFRLFVGERRSRVLRDRMIAKAHFMTRRYHSFNRPVAIRAPARGR